MCGANPKQWAHWLVFAEYWYNTSYHSAIKMSPFEALYGYKPTPLAIPQDYSVTVSGVEQTVRLQQVIQQQLKHFLTQARDRMKHMADKHRQERSFQVGDWVYLKLKPYRQLVVQRVGEVAYKLQLPLTSRIHPVFHVSLLKKRIGASDSVSADLPVFDAEGKVIMHPISILDRRLVKRNNTGVPQVLIRWAHLPVEEATWEDYYAITQAYPHLTS
ncbi:hypothetical protein DH2020_001990 [Rehmannia glutinosa]|uniref:Uncharacterized protein n=1 Tax=Rehmannia glutinosa TaxID=99300 RepID=A0ABR0XT60_REHGL